MSVQRYPLAWPDGWPRAKGRRSAAFQVTFDKAVKELGYEIERMGGRYPGARRGAAKTRLTARARAGRRSRNLIIP